MVTCIDSIHKIIRTDFSSHYNGLKKIFVVIVGPVPQRILSP